MGFPTKPPHLRPRHRGRDAPAYGPLICPSCARKVKMKSFAEWVFHCVCGWRSRQDEPTAVPATALKTTTERQRAVSEMNDTAQPEPLVNLSSR